VVENQINNYSWDQSVWSVFICMIKSPLTRQKYQKRLEKFFDFLGMESLTVEDKSKSFIKRIPLEDMCLLPSYIVQRDTSFNYIEFLANYSLSLIELVNHLFCLFSCCPFLILLVANLFHPIRCLSIKLFLDSNMCHGCS
jgi:hypothetical protein